jgi:hypothetical protein
MTEFVGFDRITVADLQSYVTICTNHKNDIIDMINSTKPLDEKIDFMFDQLNQIVSYAIIIQEIALSNISSVSSDDANIYHKSLNDISKTIHDLEFEFEPTNDKGEYVKYWMSQTYDNDIIKQIMDIRDSVSNCSEYDKLSIAYNKILCISYKSALSLKCKSITDFYNKTRLHTNDETIYNLIKKVFSRYAEIVNADTIMDKIIEDSKNSYSGAIHDTSNEDVMHYKRQIIDMLKNTFSKYVTINDSDDIMVHLTLNNPILSNKEHRIIVLLDGVSFSHTTYFINNNKIYHLIGLKHKSSFYHELGHVIDNIMMLSNEGNCYCVFLTGKQILEEMTPIVFEHFDSESKTKLKHENSIHILMSGFDYYINKETFNNIPTEMDIIVKFNIYIKMIFPKVIKDTLIPYYLMDSSLIHNTGRIINYYVNYLLAIYYYEIVLLKDTSNMDIFVEAFMKKKLLNRVDVLVDGDLLMVLDNS